MARNPSELPNIYGLQGYAPAPGALVDFQSGEVINQQAPGEELVVLTIPAGLQKRKIYCAVFLNNTNNAYHYARVFVDFYSNQSKIASLPAHVGQVFGPGPASTPDISSVFSYGSNFLTDGSMPVGNEGTDLLLHQVLNTQAWTPPQPNNIVLFPVYLTGTFDQLKIRVAELVGVANVRIFVGCFSSN